LELADGKLDVRKRNNQPLNLYCLKNLNQRRAEQHTSAVHLGSLNHIIKFSTKFFLWSGV